MEGDSILQMPLVQKAHAFTMQVYKTTVEFPKEEQYGLTSQLRRAAVSVPANICEGRGHSNDREMHRYLGIARASLSEVTYLLLLAKDLGYLPMERYSELYAQTRELGRMTAGLQTYIRQSLKVKRR